MRTNQTGFRLDGGLGADTLTGGMLNDIYVVDNAGDVVIENGTSSLHDTIQSSATLSTVRLATFLAAISGTGNTLNNLIVGNNAANMLNGDAGDDTLYGDGGNDYLHGNAGNDMLSGDDGDDAFEGDAFEGGMGNDTLTGGTGADYLMGGAGNDVYVFRRGDGSDMIVEDDAAVGNLDTVRFDATIFPSDIKVTRDERLSKSDFECARNGGPDHREFLVLR